MDSFTESLMTPTDWFGQPIAKPEKRNLADIPTVISAPGSEIKPTENAAQADAAVANVTSSAPITSDTLKSEPDMNLTPAPTPVEAAAMGGLLEWTAKDFAEKNAERKKSADKYNDFLKGVVGPTELTDILYGKNGGVDTIQTELDDINSQILAEQHALRRGKEAILSRGGGLAGGAQAEINNLERASIAKQADLSIIQMAIQGKYDSAKTIADRAVAVAVEKQKTELDALKFNYDENKDLFTTAEQRTFNVLYDERKRALDNYEAELKSIKDIAIEAAKNGAPSSVVQRMLSAKSVSEAAGVSGGYLSEKTGTGSDLDRMLSVSEAAALGVPFGTTAREAIGKTSSGSAKLSAAQKDDLATMDTVSGEIDKLIALGTKSGWAGVGGLGQGSIKNFFAKNFGLGSKEGQDMRNYVGNVNATIAKLRGGTSFTESEKALLETYTPTINDDPMVILSKANGLKEFIASRKQNLLNPDLSIQTSGGQSNVLIGPDGNVYDATALTPDEYKEAINAGYKPQ